MPLIQYIEDMNLRSSTREIIQLANQIARTYRERGYNLTLRQLYYQFVARDYFPNSEKSYGLLGRTISNARLLGLFDWDLLEDRGREAHHADWMGHVPPPQQEIIRKAQFNYTLDLWEGQPRRIEVWVEKQALEEVASKAAGYYRTGYIACKGYMSMSEMWSAGRRFHDHIANGYDPLVIHLGDHDPSGIDMTRDIEERLTMFAEGFVEVRRIALNMDQIDQYNPPPNPAKMTDSRAGDYVSKYGRKSWELDALEPDMLVSLIRQNIEGEMDQALFTEKLREERAGRDEFDRIADRWEDIEEFLRDTEDEEHEHDEDND